ncbi:MAG: hypothetical protein GY841_15805 [FCB group bacterium]|nr:hypothetical protein [FCB group bacterium]
MLTNKMLDELHRRIKQYYYIFGTENNIDWRYTKAIRAAFSALQGFKLTCFWGQYEQIDLIFRALHIQIEGYTKEVFEYRALSLQYQSYNEIVLDNIVRRDVLLDLHDAFMGIEKNKK